MNDNEITTKDYFYPDNLSGQILIFMWSFLDYGIMLGLLAASLMLSLFAKFHLFYATIVIYVQSTAVDELYFENIAARLKHERVINDTTVTAICYQSAIFDGKTNSYKVIYKFNLKRSESKWLISAVEILS